MNKPGNQPMKNIKEIIYQISDLERLVEQKKATLEPAVKKFVDHYQNEDEVLEAISYLYGYVPEIQGKHISKAIGLKSQVC